MKFLIYNFIIFANILITLEEKENNKKNDISNKNNNDNKDIKSKKIKEFLFHISLIVIFVILLFVIIKIIVKYCKKKLAFEKLFDEFSKHKLMREEAIDQVKYVFGFNYVISFLKDIVFISCKYKHKINELKNCGNCSICLSGFILSDKIFITACNHVYHNKCMTDYLNLIFKEIESSEKEIHNFHNYFQCPNCKEYLFTNRNFLPQNKKDEVIEEMNFVKDNQDKKLTLKDLKNDLIIISHKSKHKKNKNNMDTETSSKRTLSSLTKHRKIHKIKKKMKKSEFNKGQNNENNNENKDEIISTNNIQAIEIENNNSNIQSNMKLKDNFEGQNNMKIKNQKYLNVIINNNDNEKTNELKNEI